MIYSIILGGDFMTFTSNVKNEICTLETPNIEEISELCISKGWQMGSF